MIRPLWWVPILLCLAAGIIFLIPGGNGAGPNPFYDSIVPLAPITSIIVWIVGLLVYMIARWSTDRPMRPM